MSTYKTQDRGHTADGFTRSAVYRDGRFIGYMTYEDATDFIVRVSEPGDGYIENGRIVSGGVSQLKTKEESTAEFVKGYKALFG